MCVCVALQVRDFKHGTVCPIMIVSYETLRKFADGLAGFCDVLICDEGHRQAPHLFFHQSLRQPAAYCSCLHACYPGSCRGSAATQLAWLQVSLHTCVQSIIVHGVRMVMRGDVLHFIRNNLGNRSAWKAKTFTARTYLMLESVLIIIIINLVHCPGWLFAVTATALLVIMRHAI